MLTTADQRETDCRRQPLWGERSESKDTIEHRGRWEMEQPQVGPEGEEAGAPELKSTEEFENNSLTNAIIGAAITVHRELGPGLLESVYEKCLALELTRSGHQVAAQKEIPLTYKGLNLESGFRADLIIENKGGVCAVNGSENKILSLPVAGIMSDKNAWETGKLYQEIV